MYVIYCFLSYIFFFYCTVYHCNLPSFPTRRSSDLQVGFTDLQHEQMVLSYVGHHGRIQRSQVMELCRLNKDQAYRLVFIDRKSTRLNSSHVAISYAVFCLKKKKIKKEYDINSVCEK